MYAKSTIHYYFLTIFYLRFTSLIFLFFTYDFFENNVVIAKDKIRLRDSANPLLFNNRSRADIAAAVINGRNVSDHELNWIVSLQYPVKGQLQHRCGGSLLSRRLIVTAAHCVVHPDSRNIIYENQIGIKGGTNDHRADSNPIGVNYVALYPGYENFADNYSFIQNDIAVLRLAKAVRVDTMEQGIIELPQKDAPLPTTALVAGWGFVKRHEEHKNRHRDEILPHVLQQANVTILNLTECRTRLPGFPITDRMICTDSSLTDICQGDSGGALFEKIPNTGGNGTRTKYRILGIISASSLGCLSQNGASIFTRVSTYLSDFILPALNNRVPRKP